MHGSSSEPREPFSAATEPTELASRATLIVGQSGGPTAVINGSLAGVIEAAGRSPEIGRILGMRGGIEGLLENDLVDLSGFDGKSLDALAETPGSALGACRRRISDEEADDAIARLHDAEARYLCYIGGNDSADTTHRIASAAWSRRYELAAVAVPKTIDNDLPETDHCPGFGSIARYVATAALETSLDTRSLPRTYPIKILEVMGRDAGWVAAASALARQDDAMGPHLIYVPEHPFETDRFLTAVREVHRDLGYAVVVVAETVKDRSGQPVARDIATTDSFEHPIVRGTAEAMVRVVEQELGLVARADRPGTLQRSSAALRSSVDLAEARLVGVAAVEAAVAGAGDIMITLHRVGNDPYAVETSRADLGLIANRVRTLPDDFLAEDRTQVSSAFRDYAMPLLGPDPFPEITLMGKS